MTATTAQAGVVAFLASKSSITNLLGKEGNVPWIFQNTPQVTVEGTGKSAVVVYQEGHWTAPNAHNRLQFPRLVIDVYTAPTLDLLDDSQIAARDAESRNLAIHLAIRAELHCTDGATQTWDGLRIIDCTALTEPILFPLDLDAGEMKCHRVAYAVKVG
jgi:hypothetical protein